ncbi:short-chain dehydrogenase/reductase family 16C member 6-like isoform X2 [Pseudomyrmex gracilis]|nr:short-chain dehydrogenase/reductase family 16C member 6-like isoform X2 [Pseudomyrmex gracilis]XP_020300721.1 short-chain dehydrogenase/reductase family 16C member 6-like isoform X2 [Pseudomyrmex gracilis]XP_020300722.1 short-chain dehydrogenase/reductase family 16C member 6-like isoform X2 [Pseudomyrmex gracilis]
MMSLKEAVHIAWNIIYDLLLFVGIVIVYTTEAVILTFIPRRYRSKSIKGEVALVTGGASGIGRLIAVKLAKLGASVVVWDINKKGLAELAKEIKSIGGICYTYYCDISDKAEVYRTAKAVQIEVGNVTLLVNNAGYVCGKTFMELPDNEIDRTYKINVLSHYWITKSFLKDMMKNNHGHIVTIASVAGLLGTYNCTDYSASKFAVIGYHESLFHELKVHGFDGIYMTLVCPYLINTGMFHGVQPSMLPMLEPEFVAEEVVAGILTNEGWMILPRFMNFLVLLKYVLPMKLSWALLYHIVKGPQSMMTFKGRASLESSNDKNDSTNYKDVRARVENTRS